MANSLYNINLKALCDKIGLGCLQNEPISVQGGLLNKMFKIETSKGMFAIKALNPQIMLRDTAMGNYIFSEQVANIAYKNGIPALPAIIADGKSIQEVDGQYYLAFPWFEGKPLPPNSIDANKCTTIGELLARIHSLNILAEAKCSENNTDWHSIDWQHYLALAKAQNAEWLTLITENLTLLTNIEEKANNAYQKLSLHSIVSHRDLDPQNVLWNSVGSPMIIDWEAAGYANPAMELLEVATYWAGAESPTPDEQAFKSVICSYYKNGGSIKEDLVDVFHSSFVGKLGWLEYNMKRSLCLECSDDAEQLLGTEQVIGTIYSILTFRNTIPTLLHWIHEAMANLT